MCIDGVVVYLLHCPVSGTIYLYIDLSTQFFEVTQKKCMHRCQDFFSTLDLEDKGRKPFVICFSSCVVVQACMYPLTPHLVALIINPSPFRDVSWS